MPTGTVKFFNMQKGFGFIFVDGGGLDAFVHISEVERSGMHSLNEGQKVSFESKMDPRRAKLTRPISRRFSEIELALANRSRRLAATTMTN